MNFLFSIVFSSLPRRTPLYIMQIKDQNGKKEFFNKYKEIDEILLQPEVGNRKIVVLSIIGDYRKGKSFFLDYCLRYMYNNVRKQTTIFLSFEKK